VRYVVIGHMSEPLLWSGMAWTLVVESLNMDA